jgi:hypothetical protein
VSVPKAKSGAVTLPNTLISIGSAAFSGCTSLTSLAIPDSVTSIERSAFNSCSGLTEFTVTAGNTAYSAQDGILYNGDKTDIVSVPKAKSGALTILDSVTSIGSSAFYNCGGLTSVTLPAGLSSIGSLAFYGCTNLTSVTVLRGTEPLTTLGSSAFSNTSSGLGIYVPATTVAAYQALWSEYAANVVNLGGITVLPPVIPGDTFDLTGPEAPVAWLDGTITAIVATNGISSGSYYSGTTWPVQEDGRRKSPAIGNSQTTVTRYNFTSTGSNASLVIRLDVSSESGYDYAFVGNLDSTASMYSYYDGISGSTSKTITISVPSAGSHFVEIGYGKDNIVSDGSDCAWFTIEGQEFSWYIDGVAVAGQTAAALSLPARNYALGTHSLTVIATKNDGTLYSKTVNFTIVKE